MRRSCARLSLGVAQRAIDTPFFQAESFDDYVPGDGYFDLSAPSIHVIAGQQLRFTIPTSTDPPVAYLVWPDSVAGSWSGDPNKDLAFRTFVIPDPAP
jgi:hypothetical protein